MAEPGIIDVDHRGRACELVIAGLPSLLLTYGEPAIRNSGVRRSTLEFGDVEWIGRDGTRYYTELKLADDFIGSIISGHMKDQEEVLVELDGVKKVVVAGRVLPHPEDPINSVQIFRGDGSYEPLFPEVPSERQVGYATYVNYMVHLEELGIDVVKIDSEHYLNHTIAALYARSLRAPRPDRMVKRRIVSVDPQANAVKALYPKLSVQACESIAQVAGVELGRTWLQEIRDKNGGDLLIKDVVASLPGVGRPTIRRIFGV